MSGQIKSITDFGIFIGLDGGIDGLIHLSDLSWNTTGAVSYTHLDVYKRQPTCRTSSLIAT